MNSEHRWLKEDCIKCGKAFFILETWKKPPVRCECCRVRAISNCVEKLQAFFKQRRSVELTPSEGEFYEIWLQDIQLSNVINSIIKEKGKNNKEDILNEIIHIKRVRQIILQMEKQSKLKHKAKGKKAMPSRITNIVQGGLPSLGKRSK